MSLSTASLSMRTTLNTLDQLQVGESALVTAVGAGINTGDNSDSASRADVIRRLKELGFVQGELVKILHRGFFGEPLAIRVGQSTFALRRFEAALIGVSKSGLSAIGEEGTGLSVNVADLDQAA